MALVEAIESEIRSVSSRQLTRLLHLRSQDLHPELVEGSVTIATNPLRVLHDYQHLGSGEIFCHSCLSDLKLDEITV